VITIDLPRVLAPFAGSSTVVSLDGPCHTLGEAFAELGAKFPGVVDRVLDERGIVRPHVNVFLNQESIRFLDGLRTPVPEGSSIMIVAAVSGG